MLAIHLVEPLQHVSPVQKRAACPGVALRHALVEQEITEQLEQVAVASFRPASVLWRHDAAR
jgi:hypothetical protein